MMIVMMIMMMLIMFVMMMMMMVKLQKIVQGDHGLWGAEGRGRLLSCPNDKVK